jgi:hypothetical protein
MFLHLDELTVILAALATVSWGSWVSWLQKLGSDCQPVNNAGCLLPNSLPPSVVLAVMLRVDHLATYIDVEESNILICINGTLHAYFRFIIQ